MYTQIKRLKNAYKKNLKKTFYIKVCNFNILRLLHRMLLITLVGIIDFLSYG